MVLMSLLTEHPLLTLLPHWVSPTHAPSNRSVMLLE
jgi:hypothetical protein